MLKKAVSTTTRNIRKGEEEGYDYKYISEKKYLELKNNNKLLQNIFFAGTYYGYENKEFENIDNLIVLMGGSGTGKDTIVKWFLNENKKGNLNEFDKTNNLFVISIPATAHIFKNYIEKTSGKCSLIYMEVTKEERFKRILLGELSKDNSLNNIILYFKKEYPNNNIVDLIQKLIETKEFDSIFGFDAENIRKKKIRKIFSDTKTRVERDGEKFSNELKDLQKKFPKEVNILNVTDFSIEETGNEILKIAKKEISLKTKIDEKMKIETPFSK